MQQSPRPNATPREAELDKASAFVEGVSSKAAFESYEDPRRDHRWRLTRQNREVISDGGEGYASQHGAEEAVERVAEYAPAAHILNIGSAAFEIYEDIEEKWRWRLRHRNGRTLADSSQGYTTRTGGEDYINSVEQNAPNADVTAAE